MSDGMSDSRREERAAIELSQAASILADALSTVEDAAFGYPQSVLALINCELREAGVRLVLTGVKDAPSEPLLKAMAIDTPHPLLDVFERLIAATDHLFVAHGCDGHGWETWQTALRESHGLIDGLRAALCKTP